MNDRATSDTPAPRIRLKYEPTNRCGNMSRVALACLQWNKRAINNTYHSMGMNSALQYATEAGAILDATETPELKEFNRLRHTVGLAEAMKWRDDQFKKFE